MKGDHNKAIRALRHYFSQVVSGVSVLELHLRIFNPLTPIVVIWVQL